MPALVPPDARFRESFAAALDEFLAEGRGGPDDRSIVIERNGGVPEDERCGKLRFWVPTP